MNFEEKTIKFVLLVWNQFNEDNNMDSLKKTLSLLSDPKFIDNCLSLDFEGCGFLKENNRQFRKFILEISFLYFKDLYRKQFNKKWRGKSIKNNYYKKDRKFLKLKLDLSNR